jgi:hypothetical protein
METLNRIGATTAVVFYISSILVFTARMARKNRAAFWAGISHLLLFIPLTFLFFHAFGDHRPLLYKIQVGLALLWLAVVFVLDYLLKISFRQNRPAVIAFVMLFFAASGGLIGVAALAGFAWKITAVVLFGASAVLAFIQRSLTGM